MTIVRLFLALLLAAVATPAIAQHGPALPGPPFAAAVPARPAAAVELLQSPADALAQDAATIAARAGIAPDDARRQLALQEASVAATDAIADRFAGRLAGIALTHVPVFAIDVLLTGSDPVPDATLDLLGSIVPVSYHLGARATRSELVGAITAWQATIRGRLSHPPGMGVDPRTGELVIVVSTGDADSRGAPALRDEFAALTGVPVRIRVIDQPALDMGADGAGDGAGIEGGARVTGRTAGDPHRYLCTAGFVVTDGTRTGLATAAHCPDELTIRDASGAEVALPFVGQWGWGNQDVQINASPVPLAPDFFADTARTISRPVTGSRSRAGTRAGDIVCHRGERTGYSCSQVELTDFAPAGDLCGGACLPTWTTVAGPTCRSGDSGSPVFVGTVALGILKGGSYRSDGRCAFYFYMSTDYLPAGWRLLTASQSPATSSLATP